MHKVYVFIGEGKGTQLQYSCRENPMDRGAWWATVHGVAKESATTERKSIHATWRATKDGNPSNLVLLCWSTCKNAYICGLKASFCWILITGTVLTVLYALTHLSPHILVKWGLLLSHCRDEETEASRVTHQETEVKFQLRWSVSRVHAFNHQCQLPLSTV